MAGKSDAQNPALKAYLNYLFFDTAMNYATAGFKQISTAAKGVGVHELVELDEPFIADRQGYLLAYLSNENQEAVNIHFDDFTVYHGKTNIVQSQDYYPFGGSFNTFTRAAATPNSYLYNGGAELNEKTNYYEMGFKPQQISYSLLKTDERACRNSFLLSELMTNRSSTNELS